jgi:CHAT domain/WD40-like Beta Propeller Repeat
MTSLELELRFERGAAPGNYRVVVRGPGGLAASGRFTDPFSDLQLENFALKISRPRGVRSADSPEPQLAREFGALLFSAVFEDEGVRDAYRSALQDARRSTTPMRVTLSLTGTPELLRLPWEYLYDDPEFLAISRWTPVVRRLDVGTPRPPLELSLPIRILSLVAAPSDAEPIDAKRERVRLTTALGPLVTAGAVSIDWLEDPTLLGLTRQLDDHDYHVLHFIGHGGYEESMEDGVLLFEDGEGRSDRVSGEQLGQILRDQLTMRLVVLNACEGARASADDPFSGVATRLIHHGIPSVIGMQFEISDRAAILFASDFYAAIANGRPIDAAMARARRAIYADRNFLEWGTPVLFMRVQDGRLFELAPHDPIPRPSSDALLETAAYVGLRVTVDPDDETAAVPSPQPSTPSKDTALVEEPPAPVEPPPPAEPTPPPEPEPPKPSPPPRAGSSRRQTSWRRWRGWIAAGIAAVAVAAVVVLLLLPRPDEPLPGRIAYSTESGIMTIEPDGSFPRKVPGTRSGDRDPALTPEGDRVVYQNARGIWQAPVTTDGDPEQITDERDRNPALSQDGEVLAFARGPDDARRIYTLDLTAGEESDPEAVWNTGEDEQDPAWSPDGLTIAFVIGADLEREIVVFAEGSPLEHFTSNNANDVDPAWSPDGDWIAFARSTDNEDFDIWRMRVDGSETEQLTTGPAVDHDPAWSPDGRAIAFSRSEGGQPGRIFVLRIGTGEAPLPITAGAGEGHPSWR